MYALLADYSPNRSQRTIFKISRRTSRRQGLAQAPRRRAGGSAKPAVAGEAETRLAELPARKGGRRRSRSADFKVTRSACELSFLVFTIKIANTKGSFCF